MSIDPTNPVTKIGSSLNREMINPQTNKQKSLKFSKDSLESANVTLSEKATQLLSSDQDIDVEKVEKIKQAIREGKLAVDTTKIADAIINQALQHVNRRSAWR